MLMQFSWMLHKSVLYRGWGAEAALAGPVMVRNSTGVSMYTLNITFATHYEQNLERKLNLREN